MTAILPGSTWPSAVPAGFRSSMLAGGLIARRWRRKRERTRAAGTRRAVVSSSLNPRAAASRSIRRARDRRESAAAVAGADRRLLRSPRNVRIRRADRARGGYAARSRRAPPLVYAGGIPPRPRRVPDPARAALGPACDVARIRPP